ncbi:MAG TPA: cyclic nucleotide-binding domain-containing protein [Dehalococcoidia bacterium]|nr:cyclic nucleotide-binding domain-containing protein [Dehalococcoidia bacterium]
MQSDVERTLTRVPLFRQLGRAYMLDIAHNADLRDFDAGETIVAEGDPSESFYVIVRGSVEVLKEREKGAARVVTTLEDGQYFGELSIFDNQPRSATVRATKATTCLVIPRWEILQTVEASPEVSKRMLAYLSSRLRATTDALPFD